MPTKVQQQQQQAKSRITCSCGSTINRTSLSQHLRTKKHQQQTTPQRTHAEYQRRRFKQNPDLREQQRQKCRDWYSRNKTSLLARRAERPCFAKRKQMLESRLARVFRRHLVMCRGGNLSRELNPLKSPPERGGWV